MKETKVFRIPLFIEDVESLIILEGARSAAEAIQECIDKRLSVLRGAHQEERK